MSEFSPFSAEMSDMELAVTKSRIKGWRLSSHKRRYFNENKRALRQIGGNYEQK